MMSYTAPNPYVEGVPYKGNAPTTNSNSIMGMIGITPRGELNKAILVTSWTEFIEKFAAGCASPFMTNSYLSYAVFGFFQNGGSLLNIVRVADNTAKKATSEALSTGTTIIAKDEGTWGNNLKVRVAVGDDETFNIYVKCGEELVEVISEVSNDALKENYAEYAIENSNYIAFGEFKNLATTDVDDNETYITLSGGVDGITSVTDDTYTGALKCFDKVHNLIALGIPGQATQKVVKALDEYTKGKPIVPVYEFPEATQDVEGLEEFIKANLKGKQASFYGPYLKITDPLSVAGRIKEVPPVGHIMGTMARTIDTKGEWEAPAGTHAVIKGVVGVAKEYTDEERGKLNELGANILLVKPNYGTVIWGARSLSSDKKQKYVSNLILDSVLRRNIDDAMQQFEFRQNGPALWTDITSEITGILETKRLAGAFAGTTKEESYYVLCDASLNTQAVIDSGTVICEVGYASNNPAEFIIVRVAHQLN